jgi:predicted RNA-binding Zn-ribbon protein involved in translation (DUF1610 family)
MPELKPHPADVAEARDWLMQRCPCTADASAHINTLIQTLKLLPSYDPLYCWGTPESKAAYACAVVYVCPECGEESTTLRSHFCSRVCGWATFEQKA